MFKVFFFTGKSGIGICVGKVLVKFFQYKTVIQDTIPWRNTSIYKYSNVSWYGFTISDFETWYKERRNFASCFIKTAYYHS